MAIAITDRKWLGTAEQIEAVLDSDADLASLTGTYAPGSTAVVADGGKTYMVNASGIWKVVRE